MRSLLEQSSDNTNDLISSLQTILHINFPLRALLIKGYRFRRPPARIGSFSLRSKYPKSATSNHPPASPDTRPLQHIFLRTRLLILPMDEPPTKASHCTAVLHPWQRLARQTTHRRPRLRRQFPAGDRLPCRSLGPLALPHHTLDARILKNSNTRHSGST